MAAQHATVPEASSATADSARIHQHDARL